MRGYEAKNLPAYRLEDAKTGLTLLLIPTYAYGSPHLALCAAGRQARRHAAGGTWVLVRGEDKALLYVGEHCFVPCEECGKWMLPRRRGNHCPECRAEEPQQQVAVSSGSSRSRKAASRPAPRRRRPPLPAPGQLTLPDLQAEA
jgi:hypothetical protein